MKKLTQKEKQKIVKEFLYKFFNNQKDIPADMRLSDEEFWNLL